MKSPLSFVSVIAIFFLLPHLLSCGAVGGVKAEVQRAIPFETLNSSIQPLNPFHPSPSAPILKSDVIGSKTPDCVCVPPV